MSRLVRGLWHVEWRFRDRLMFEPELPIPYHQAEAQLAIVAEGAVAGQLRCVAGTRAPWEFIAPFEATDKPRWNED